MRQVFIVKSDFNVYFDDLYNQEEIHNIIRDCLEAYEGPMDKTAIIQAFMNSLVVRKLPAL